ncbi:carbohydrate ABC transporter permease [Caldanaerobacter subterraneus]|uniref:carbohydrate ABC transporter permease n=1 Tax=Caldanaerobacter subterraneus TaxID=911092 RepID=UPI000405611D|nr:sugar ABC transporter permease [Caldanaerobacter subterraneus]
MSQHKSLKDKLRPYAYLSPAILSMTVLSFAPMAYTIYIAFTNFNLYHFKNYQFVGFKNFVDILTGPFKNVFAPVFVWTVIYALSATLLSYIVGLLLAVILNNKHMWETNFYRAILIIPWGLPGTIAVLTWTGLLNQQYGGINLILQKLHLPMIPWLLEPFWAKVAIIMVSVWMGYPFMMNASLGALQAIPPELYEVADIDGASWFQKLTKITLPMLTSSTLPLIISSFAYNFNNFGTAFLITGGGPPRTDTSFAGHTDILVSAAYKLTMQANRYDLASALSIIIFLIIGTLSLLNMRLTGAFKEVD